MQSASGLVENGIFYVYGETHPLSGLGMLALRIKNGNQIETL